MKYFYEIIFAWKMSFFKKQYKDYIYIKRF